MFTVMGVKTLYLNVRMMLMITVAQLMVQGLCAQTFQQQTFQLNFGVDQIQMKATSVYMLG